MCVSVEYVTNIKRIHITGEGHFFTRLVFPALSPSLSTSYFLVISGVKKNHIIIFIDYHQRQTNAAATTCE